MRKPLPNNLLSVKDPELANEWHPTKNNDLSPGDVSFASTREVWWKCGRCGWSWRAVIRYRYMNTQRSRCRCAR